MIIDQYWLHSQFIGKLPFLEGILNTPSAHRVHHGSNPVNIDKNYGGILMIWDRMFGTYQPETEKIKYGVTPGSSRDLLRYSFFLIILTFKGKLKAKWSIAKKIHLLYEKFYGYMVLGLLKNHF